MSGAPHVANAQSFLRGNGLPERWRGRERFVVLETSFGDGHSFLATWAAWANDPQRSQRLHFIAVDKCPPTRHDLEQAHAASTSPALMRQMLQAWPPLTRNLHRLSFDNGRVQLLLAWGHQLAEIVASVDAFFLDPSDFDDNPAAYLAKALARLAAPRATLASLKTSTVLQKGLSNSGFEVCNVEDQLTLATYAPRFIARKAPARIAMAAGNERHALIVGAGLAGCAVAWALAEQGWHSTVLDRLPGIAQATSGNPAGLFHGVVNPQDGAHARFNRAAALQAQHAVRMALEEHGVAGQLAGVLRLESNYALADMQRQLSALGLPADYVQALAAESASELSGLPLEAPAWFYPGAGWVHPAGLAESFLRRAGTKACFQAGAEVACLREAGSLWQLLDETGRVLAQAGVVVLANALDAQRLLGGAIACLYAVRGQVTQVPGRAPGLTLPRIPVAGAGYVLPRLPSGDVLCGATSQRDDMGQDLRVQDHEQNLAQLAHLTGSEPRLELASLKGRVGWRCVAADRLPIIGAVPDVEALQRSGLRLDQPRLVPRKPGLFVFTALGSRGITWAALGAQTLAAVICGAPCPLEASLLDTVDVARFSSRAARRQLRG